MANWLKCFATLAMMVCLVYGRPYAADRDMMRGGEMFTLAMFALMGIFVMMSGSNFLVIYLGLELLTLCSYALGGAAPRPRHVHRGGDEVLRTRRDGQRLPALRHVHALRCDRIAGHRHRLQDRELRAR
jgi:NADH:ubiquinone oxidoreductase subunit 5 (subunit L)/multisubunit Na+/H+ antiporter MnhA subunit